MMFGQLSEKADVYSFGVLVLEIMSGKRNIDPTMTEQEVYLPNRVSLSNSNACTIHLAQFFELGVLLEFHLGIVHNQDTHTNLKGFVP